MYKLLAKVAHQLGPVKARKLAEYSIKMAPMVAGKQTPPSLRKDVMGLSFPGPVGLAAGFDKHGTLYPFLPSLGFGFAEIGSVVPMPELQRSHGIDAVAAILSRHQHSRQIPLGVSISMNRMTPPERMPDDYVACMQALWKSVDYLTINLGVRAGPDLHLPEHCTTLHSVLTAVKNAQERFNRECGLHRPVLVKVDQTRGNTIALLASVQAFDLDGLVLSGEARKGEEKKMLIDLERVANTQNGRTPVISVGGIRTPQDVADRLSAGAALVQIYSGIVESGPLLPQRINAHLSTIATAP